MIRFSDGVLAELAAQTGEASKERLLEIARAAYFRYKYVCRLYCRLLQAPRRFIMRRVVKTFRSYMRCHSLFLQPHQWNCARREQQNKTLKKSSFSLPVIKNMSVHCKELYF